MATPRLPRAAMNASRKVPFLLGNFLSVLLLAASARATEPPAATPFSARSVPEGPSLFTELPSDRTGIVTTNRYDDPRMWNELHREYHVGAIGTGVAVGDYDGDGRPDLFIVSKVESGRLFRNLGGWRFADVTAAAGVGDDSGAWKQGAAFADVNNDGHLDLYVCRFNVPNQLFMNRGDGTFREEAAARGLALADASGMACFADYDRDGWLDVYIQTNLGDFLRNPEGQRDRLYRNNGDGTFRDVTDSAGLLTQPTQGHSATWWDYNEDGWPDLFVANDFAPPDFLYRNNRDGTFTKATDEVLPHTPFSSMGSDLGDVDNDGRLDLLATDMAGTTWERTQRGLADSRARASATQNDDQTGRAVQLLHNALYLNTGTDRMLEAAHLAGLAATDWTWSVRFEDLDQDGRLDLFVTNGMDREQNNLDMIERRLAAISEAERIRITKTSPVLNQANLAYRNLGGLRFEETGRAWGLGHVGVSFGAAFGDFDGDGDLDLVFTNFEKGATVLRNDGQNGRSVILDLRGTASNRFGIGTRVEATTKTGTQVRELVLARGYLSTSEPAVHFGFGADETIEQLTITWPSGRVQTLTNLPTGRRYTVTEPATDTAQTPPERRPSLFAETSGALGLAVTQREEVLEGTIAQPLLPRRFNRRGPGIAVGDLDKDGRDEIVIAATVRDGARILHREGTVYRPASVGVFALPPPLNDGPPLIFDANGDGANDLLFTAGGAALPAEEPEYEPRLWLNDGRGGFVPAPDGTLPSLPISVGAAVAADFDRDGRLDLFLGGRLLPGYYPEPATSALLLQRDGRLTDATDSFAPGLREAGLVSSAVASDADGDGWIDLIVTLEWGGVHLFRNQQGRGLADESARQGFDSAGTGWWTALTAGDFNGDGRPDYAVGNLGLNTIFRATPEHPLRLFAGDFAGRRGEPQLVLAQDDGGGGRPVASRGELATRIPTVLRRFASNNRYAAASLEEILGREALAKATVHTAGELRSGVLLSQPDGRHAFSPLPHLAQISPVQGLAAGDFDGDGHADLLLAGNDYSPIPAHGRFDSGLGWWLRGNGRSGFTPVPPAESGWVIPGNAKALALTDLDGDARPDAIVTRNNEPALAFRSAHAGVTVPVAVRLRGQGGNPDAIGARISLVSGGRILQTAEVHAGGGFASQSTATLFFAIARENVAGAKFRIRWPSGRETEAAVPANGGYTEVAE